MASPQGAGTSKHFPARKRLTQLARPTRAASGWFSRRTVHAASSLLLASARMEHRVLLLAAQPVCDGRMRDLAHRPSARSSHQLSCRANQRGRRMSVTIVSATLAGSRRSGAAERRCTIVEIFPFFADDGISRTTVRARSALSQNAPRLERALSSQPVVDRRPRALRNPRGRNRQVESRSRHSGKHVVVARDHDRSFGVLV